METDYFVFQGFLFMNKSQNTTTSAKELCLIIVVRLWAYQTSGTCGVEY